ncbi:hypothetical protein CRUP_000143 [Coryphaenoides rupestris]|nr:hypothetical protein CRUP_000143 [Coryphaenoides rupestris]
MVEVVGVGEVQVEVEAEVEVEVEAHLKLLHPFQSVQELHLELHHLVQVPIQDVQLRHTHSSSISISVSVSVSVSVHPMEEQLSVGAAGGAAGTSSCGRKPSFSKGFSSLMTLRSLSAWESCRWAAEVAAVGGGRGGVADTGLGEGEELAEEQEEEEEEAAASGRFMSWRPRQEAGSSWWSEIYQEIEICPKATRAVRFDNADSCAIRYGFSVVVMEEEGEEEGGQSQIYVTEVKPEGSASAKGVKVGDEILLLNGTPASALRMDDLRGAFLRPALTLSLSTLPPIDSLLLCPRPPRRPDRDPDPTTDIFSRDQEDILGPTSPASRWTAPTRLFWTTARSSGVRRRRLGHLTENHRTDSELRDEVQEQRVTRLRLRTPELRAVVQKRRVGAVHREAGDVVQDVL